MSSCITNNYQTLGSGADRSRAIGKFLLRIVGPSNPSEIQSLTISKVQCSAAIHHLITNAVFNISSDLMMMAIPLPLLINSRLPPLKLVKTPFSTKYSNVVPEKQCSAVSSGSGFSLYSAPLSTNTTPSVTPSHHNGPSGIFVRSAFV